MKAQRVAALTAAIILVAGGSFGQRHLARAVGISGRDPGVVAQETTLKSASATTGNIPLIAINPAICFALVFAKFTSPIEGASRALNCTKLDSRDAATDPVNGLPTTRGHLAMMDLEKVIGNGDGKLEPSDFAGVDLAGSQVHQSDDDGNGTSQFNGNLMVLAFVNSTGSVRFSTNLGLIIPPGLAAPGQDLTLNSADTAGQAYVCDAQSGTASGALVEDADCTGGTNPDGVVVARLRAHWDGSTADIGPGTVTVIQGPSDVGTIAFRVVGEPRTLSLGSLENTIQDGAGGEGQCPLPGGAAGFLNAGATAERAMVLATAKDIDGNSVTGAFVTWSTDDPNKAKLAAGLTPTLDLGSFGFTAPNIICGTVNPGTVTAEGLIDQEVQNLPLDPGASLASATEDFTVVGAPATLTPSPTATFTPSATPTETPTPTSTPIRCLTPNEKGALLLAIVRHLGARSGEPGYVSRYDLNQDGVIEVRDLVIAAHLRRCE